MAKRPNILMIVTDQHRPDFTGFGGNSVVKTPNLDALAAQSMRFDKAYVANPICMPNRSTIFTGRMPSVHGTRYNGIALDPKARTFPGALRAAGYRTAHIGKCPPAKHGQLTRNVGPCHGRSTTTGRAR